MRRSMQHWKLLERKVGRRGRLERKEHLNDRGKETSWRNMKHWGKGRRLGWRELVCSGKDKYYHDKRNVSIEKKGKVEFWVGACTIGKDQ